MKKKAVLVLIPLLCMTLSGCLDIFQYITKDDKGVCHNTIKITVSKSLLEMAGESGEDMDGLFDDDEFGEKYRQAGARVSKVNDDTEAGVMIKSYVDYRNPGVNEKIKTLNTSFIPWYDKTSMIIPIGEGEHKSFDNEYAALFMASSKYRLVISKKCTAVINRVVLRNEGNTVPAAFSDLGDVYLIEVPVMTLLGARDIVIETK